MKQLNIELLERQTHGFYLRSNYRVEHRCGTTELCCVNHDLDTIWDEMSNEMQASIGASERIAVVLRFYERHPELDPIKVSAALRLLDEWEPGGTGLDRAA